MRTTFSARLASEADNEQLLELTRLCPIEGTVILCTEREPDFFSLNKLQGHPWSVGVIESCDGHIVGCGSIAVREVYIDGMPTLALYAGDLKIAPSARYSVALRQLYEFLWAKVRTLGIKVGHTSIIEGNTAARVLVRRHLGMPIYRAAGLVRVCAVNFRLPKKPPSDYVVDNATEADVPEIVAMLNRGNSQFNFAPVWNEARFEQALRVSPGLSLRCFYVARKGDRMMGVLAAWDQSSFQRTRILAYPLHIAAYRYIYNITSCVLGFPRMPAKRGVLKQIYCTHLAIENDQPAILKALLTRIHNEYRTRGYHLFTFGLAEGHPLLEALRGFSFRSFRTVAYSLGEPGSRWESYDFTRLPVFHEISHI